MDGFNSIWTSISTNSLWPEQTADCLATGRVIVCRCPPADFYHLYLVQQYWIWTRCRFCMEPIKWFLAICISSPEIFWSFDISVNISRLASSTFVYLPLRQRWKQHSARARATLSRRQIPYVRPFSLSRMFFINREPKKPPSIWFNKVRICYLFVLSI